MDADRILDILAIVGIIAVHSAGLVVVWMTYGSEPDPNESDEIECDAYATPAIGKTPVFTGRMQKDR